MSDLPTQGSPTLVADLHSDVPVDVVRRVRNGERRVMSRRHLPRWRKGGVTASVLAIGGDSASQWVVPGDPERSARATAEALLADIEGDPAFVLVREAGDLDRAVARGAFAVILALEGSRPVERDLSLVDEFHRLGVRSITLTWNFANRAGDGAGATVHGGLSEFGRALVGRMNELGILVDLAHAAPETFRQALEISRLPCYVSHANLRSLCDHPRNLTDEQVRALARRGGLVGISCYPGFVTGAEPATLEHVLAHVDRAVRMAGEDHVAIGTDFVDFAAETILGALPGSGVPYDLQRAYPRGIENVESFANLLHGMRRHLGYREERILKIAGGNFRRLLREHDRTAR